MRKAIADPYVLGYCVFYSLALVGLRFTEHFPLSEAVAATVIFAIVLPLTAYAVSRSATRLSARRPAVAGEVPVLVTCVLVVVAYLAVGATAINAFLGLSGDASLVAMLSTSLQKLLVFVFIPFFLYAQRFGFGVGDFGLRGGPGAWWEHKQLRILLILGPLMVGFQLLAGQAAQPVRQGEFSALQLLVGLPPVFVWLLVNVGLTEEFFFRALIQDRVTARLRSESAGVVIGATLFGLAHAPGLILRGAGASSPLGPAPSPLLAVCYSIVVLSAAGLFLGIVWSRTRNLWLVMAIHAATDLLVGFVKFAEIWGTAR